MKKIFLIISAILLTLTSMAQEKLAFPFQGGKDVMTAFFRDSLIVSAEMVQKRASGVVVFKFSADDKGRITKMVIYYADDAVLASPVIDVLKKSNHKWVIPDHEKSHDFIMPFNFSFNPPPAGTPGLQKAVYNFYAHRKPIFSTDQIPLDEATLLPTIMINYDITQ
ncbi:MAG TPA: hypothetical protein VGN20_04665 [Mucilaginibacter sp.]|jgi:hypothetical protein